MCNATNKKESVTQVAYLEVKGNSPPAALLSSIGWTDAPRFSFQKRTSNRPAKISRRSPIVNLFFGIISVMCTSTTAVVHALNMRRILHRQRPQWQQRRHNQHRQQTNLIHDIVDIAFSINCPRRRGATARRHLYSFHFSCSLVVFSYALFSRLILVFSCLAVSFLHSISFLSERSHT